MKKPNIIKDEQARLNTLRSLGVLDTPKEERFDRLTRLAKRLFDVPIALVSLVDENRQWFKSCVGLSISETPRDISFCGHAILGEDLFIIPDTCKDARFADNPLVVDEPYIRFYAGCPLSAPDGSQLGTLCILDCRPRIFDQEDMEALADLASMVERELSAIQQATLDELTNISNRRGFITLAEQSLKLCARQKLAASLIFIDLDNFKQVNDTFGHAEGDRALIAFAEQIKAVCRESDICGRLGGDEFAMLLVDLSEEEANSVVLRLNQSVNKYNQEAKRGYDILFSNGVLQICSDKHPTIEAMLAEVDSLMYAHKGSKD